MVWRWVARESQMCCSIDIFKASSLVPGILLMLRDLNEHIKTALEHSNKQGVTKHVVRVLSFKRHSSAFLFASRLSRGARRR